VARKWRRSVEPARRPTAASKALLAARSAARLRLDQTAKGLGVHPRTVTRWELGETRPSPEEWARVAAFFVRYAPEAAVTLAKAAGVPSPIPAPVPADDRAGTAAGVPLPSPARAPVDDRAVEAAIVRAADRLDVAPRRVRAALRDIVAAVETAHGTLRDLARAAEDPEPADDARGSGRDEGRLRSEAVAGDNPFELQRGQVVSSCGTISTPPSQLVHEAHELREERAVARVGIARRRYHHRAGARCFLRGSS
jgi:transcriptional regulator with XRE-family HTH domain